MRQVSDGKDFAECFKTEPCYKCHKGCMVKVSKDPGSDERETLPSSPRPDDCYFNPECHKLVDWDGVTAAKMSFFSSSKQPDKLGEVRSLAAELQAQSAKAGVPEDSVGYMVSKWVNAAVKDYVCSNFKLERNSLTIFKFHFF